MLRQSAGPFLLFLTAVRQPVHQRVPVELLQVANQLPHKAFCWALVMLEKVRVIGELDVDILLLACQVHLLSSDRVPCQSPHALHKEVHHFLSVGGDARQLALNDVTS